MSYYTYQRRAPGDCRAQVAVRSSSTGKNLANARALYERPVLVHTGPTPMRMSESLNLAYPWPWVRLDTASGVPTRLDEATVWPLRSTGSLDVSLRLVGIYAQSSGSATSSADDPTTLPTVAPCEVKAEVLQYLSGTSPTLLASATAQVNVVAYPNYTVPWYPLLSLLSRGMRAPGDGVYNPAIQGTGSGGLLRVGQFYPADLPLLQRVKLTVDWDDATWSPNYATARQFPLLVRVSCVLAPGATILWDPTARPNPEYVRIFCVGSAMYQRGRT